MSDRLNLRPACRSDVPTILMFIKALADYEDLLDEVIADEALLERQLFDEKRAEVVLAVSDGKEIGFALFFHNFSTFLGRSGIYLEDLFILPEYRGRGFGKAILSYLARLALSRGCGRLEWSCLDRNTPSVEFYLSLGAQRMDEWTVYRVTGDTLNSLGGLE